MAKAARSVIGCLHLRTGNHLRFLFKIRLGLISLTTLLAVLPCFLSGCATPWQTAGLAAGLTVAGAQAPTTEMEQIYYLGVLDPQEQVPTAIYRVRVHGQASFISTAKFASGWVPAALADSLTSKIGYDDSGNLQISRVDTNSLATLQTGRRLILFGPEGFREAPRDSRLVIIMGSDPSKYFEAVNDVMAKIAEAKNPSAANDALIREILLTLTSVEVQKDALQQILDELPAQPPSS